MTNGLPPLPEGFELETPVAPRTAAPQLPSIPEGFELEAPIDVPSPAAGAQAAGGFTPGTGARGGTSPEQVERQFGTAMGALRRAQLEREKGLRGPEALSEGLAVRRELGRQGITEGAPAGARATASFAFDPEEGVKRALERSFADAGLPTENLNLRKRRIMGKDFIVYTDPRTGQRKAWNVPGASLADVAGLAGEATVLVPEILGATGGVLAGGGAGGPAGAAAGGIGGGALGAAMGELTRLQVGKKLGLSPELEGEGGAFKMAMSALQQAGLSAAGGAVVAGFLRMARRMFAGVPGDLDDVSVQQFDEAIERYENLAADVEARTGEEFPATVGQVLERPDIIDIERKIAKEPTGAELRSILEQQEGALRSLEDEVRPPEGFLNEERLGELIKKRMEEGPERGLRTLESRSQAASEAVEEAQQSIASLASPQDQAAADARRVMEGTRTEVRGNLDTAYDLLARAIPNDLNVNIQPVAQYLMRQASRRNQELFRSLAPDVSGLMRDLLDPKGRSPVLQERLAQGQFPYADFWNSLKVVKDRVRHLQDKQRSVAGLTQEEANNYAVLKDLRDVMEQQRAASLQRYPELADANDQITRAYRTYKDVLDKQVADNYLKQKGDGTYALKSERMVDSVLTNGQAAETLVRAVQTYPTMRPALDALRRGARQSYLDFVVNPKTGAINPARHNAFMRETGRGPGMRALFGDGILDFQKARHMAQSWADAEVVQKQATDRLNKAFGMKMRNFEASEVVDKLWKPGKLESLRRLRRILPPELWREFQAATRAKDMAKVTSWDEALQAPTVRADKLQAYLDKNAAAIEQVHGSQYLRDMRLLERALKTAAVRKPVTPTDFMAQQNLSEQKAGPTLHATRAMVGMFTTAGRMLTASIRLNERTATKALIHAMANPRILRRLMLNRERLRNVQDNAKVRILSNIYGPTAYEAIFGTSVEEQE